MYQVRITSGTPTVIHGNGHRLKNAKIKYKKNAIGSFSFDIYPQNPGFNLLQQYATTIEVTDTRDGAVVFEGRVLDPAPSMDAKGMVKKSVTCEHVEAYLLDSTQPYVDPRTWDNVRAFVAYMLDVHNAHVPSHKRVQVGNVEVPTFKYSDGLYKGIPRGNTWEILHAQLTKSYGGEMRVRRTNGALYLDYGLKLGTTRSTTVELGKNIKSSRQEASPEGVITRLYPYGAKKTRREIDEDGNATDVETEERIGIEEANGGVAYIEDSAAVSKYGIIEGYHEWDDVTLASNLLSKAREWLTDNNAIPVSNTITALDLSLLGIDPDKFEFLDWYRCVNPLIGLDATLEIVEHTIDVTNPNASTFGVGEVSATGSGNMASLNGLSQKIEVIESQAKSSIANVQSSIASTQSKLLVMEDEIAAEVKKTVVTEITNVKTETSKEIVKLENKIEQSTSGYVLSIESSHGTVFPDGIIETVLTARVFKGTDELTAEEIAEVGEVVWYVDGEEVNRGITFTVNQGDVRDGAKVVAQLEGMKEE